jgi:hypothetical protein
MMRKKPDGKERENSEGFIMRMTLKKSADETKTKKSFKCSKRK